MGNRQVVNAENRPFGLPWLDSCYQESLLPDAPWHQVRDKLSSALAQKMEKHMDNEQRRQMMFELLGQHFQMNYFPTIANDPGILEPPKTSPEDRQKIELDTNNWLQVAIHEASSEMKCQRPNIVQDEHKDVAPEMEDFLHHTKAIVSKGMERHLFLQEEILVKKKKLKLDAIEKLQEDREMWNKYQMASKRKHDASHIKGILKNPPIAGPTRINADGDDIFKPPPTAQIKADLYVPDTQPPLWGYQADSLGRSLVAILKRDPRRFGEITWRLHGRQLPGTLRSYIWLDVLLLASREDYKGTEVNVEKIVRERFGKLVSRGMEEMRVTRATHSPISSLIDKAAIELYDTTPSMKAYIVDNNHMRDTSKALNVIYCFDRSYAPYLIYWLFPFQLAFKEHSGQREHAYELALYLHLLERSCFPKWPEVFSLAERVLDSLRVADEELLLHLKEISSVAPSINTKEFMVEMIHLERSKAELLKKNQPHTETDQQDSARLFTDPLIYIRKWIGEAFVSVLDTPAVLWLWDQLFMEKWERKIIVDVCVALLLLLKHKLMEAEDHESMAEVFYREPCKLYTKDIQRAWMHLQYGGDPQEVPLFNRRRPKPPVETPPLGTLDPVGIKGVVVYIIFDKAISQKERWVVGFDPEDVKLLCTVYYGSTILTTEVSNRPAKCPLNARQLEDGSTAYKIYFLKTALEFPNLNPSQLDMEDEFGAHPFAVIQVDYYGHEDTKAGRAMPITLGWARLQLYAHYTVTGSSQTWTAIAREEEFRLHAGGVPDSFPTDPKEPVAVVKPVYIRTDSKLRASVYDVELDPPPSPTPTLLGVEAPATPPLEAEKPNINSPFDLYIDLVDNLPDNSTFVKITGRLIKTGDLSGVPDLLVLPEMESSSRSPQFTHRLTINKEKLEADKDMVALLRVYTIDKNAKDPQHRICVIGSCLFHFFESNGDLRVGNHRRILRSGMPDLSQGVGALNAHGMDEGPRVPGCTMYLRLLPASNRVTEAPFSKQQYELFEEELNDSERRVAISYSVDESEPDRRPKTEVEMIKKVQAMEKFTGKTPDRVWMKETLDHKKYLPDNQPASSLPLLHMVEYRPPVGINVQIMRAYGLPGGRFIQCYTRVVPGVSTRDIEPTDEGYGQTAPFLTKKHDFEAGQKAPVWKDEPTLIHPYRDTNNVLVIQIFGFEVVYVPQKDHSRPGKVTNKKGKPLSLYENAVLGWAFVPLMKRESVWSGKWRVPILTRRPDAELVEELGENPIDEVFQNREWPADNFLDGGSVDIKIWDAHFTTEELPQGFKNQDLLLEMVGHKERYTLARQDTGGKPLNQTVLSTLGKKYQKLGTQSSVYKREEEYFSQVMDQTLSSLVAEVMQAS